MNQIGGMSDMGTYELEDIAWDELDQINDHIVPHPSNENENETTYQENSFMNLQHEGIFMKNMNQDEEGNIQPQKKKRTKLLKRRQNSSNTDIMDADGSTIVGEECTENDTSSCAYSLGEMSQTENDLIFWDNDHKDVESSDLLNYGWPDVENFDDVERILRSYDSNLEFGSSNEDNLVWLSSTHNIEDPSFSPIKNLPEENTSLLKNASFSDPLGNFTSMDESPIPKLTPKEQQGVQFSDILFNNSTANNSINGNGQKKKHASRPNLSAGRKKVSCKSRQVFANPDLHNQNQNIAPNDFGYLQTHTSYMHLNYQNSVGSPLSNIKSEINSLTSLSPVESSYASNQVWTTESSHRHPFSAPVMSVDEKLEKLRRRQGYIVHHSRNYTKNHSGIERGNLTKDIDSPKIMETSCNNMFDEMSLETSCFRQLQQVIEKLDTRTKLCIRDSLYRLARSAEQRHRFANMTGGGQCGQVGDAIMADISDKGFMDMETDTNPIDRSVAHLLFHRPSDPSAMPVRDGSSLKSHTMIHESITSPLLMVNQLVCHEEAANKAEKTVCH